MSQQRYYFNLLCHSSTPGEGRGAGEGLAERRVAGPPVLTATVSLEKKPLQSHLTSGQKPEGLSDRKLSQCF